MRRSWLPVVVAVVLMERIASSALASLSVVADLDSNATNGPDSLVIEPTDTVLVHLWFVGSDSILSYGVTLGDTTGALTWVPETTSTIYTSPSGWADIPVYQDSLGWLLLQATDFSGETPIQVPCEFARLKFYIAAGDSCGTLEGDLNLSGWFNLDLGENSFTGFEGPTVCVTEVLDGGGDAPDQPGGEGGGGFDNATAECETLPCCDYVEDKPETGRVWVVNDNGTIGTDCDCNDIQACIDSAVAGDTVCVNPGTYTELHSLPFSRADEPKDGFNRIDAAFTILKDDIVVKSSAGAEATFVGNDTATASHVCGLLGDTTDVLEDVVVAGFTMHGGRTRGIFAGEAWGAGAMLCTKAIGASVTIRDNIFEDNEGPHGAAIRIHGGEPEVINNIFRDNRLVPVTGSACQGGAIQVTYQGGPQIEPRIVDNHFFENAYGPGTVRGNGGALSFESAGGLVLGNTFAGCSAARGGAIYLAAYSACPTILRNVFASCKADSFGGAIATCATGSLFPTIRMNTFILNQGPDSQGGAIFSANPSLEVDISNNIFAYTSGGAIVLDGVSGSQVTRFSCNNFYANVGGDISGIPESLWIDIAFVDPQFCVGTSSCSLWSLAPSSPCVPAGTCDSLIGAIETCENCSLVATGVKRPGTERTESADPPVRIAPNPFNARVTITYRVQDAADDITISVFDIRGREVCRFPNKPEFAGWHTVVWDGTTNAGRAATGVYFVRVAGNGSEGIRRVLLLR